jgi:hypothetical protein
MDLLNGMSYAIIIKNQWPLVHKRTILIKVVATCRQSWCQLLQVEGHHKVSIIGPTAINLSFIDQKGYFFNQVAPQLSS